MQRLVSALFYSSPRYFQPHDFPKSVLFEIINVAAEAHIINLVNCLKFNFVHI